jgi:hypothetical protein
MRRRAALIITGVVVVLVGVGLVVTNSALTAAVEERIAGPVRSSLGADSSAQVTISRDRPLLVQLAGGHLDQVTVTADRLTLRGTDVTNVHAEASDVTIRPPYTAQVVTVVGTVPTSEIQQQLTKKGLDVQVSVAGQDLRLSGTLLGVPWGVAVAPVAAGDHLTVEPKSADIAGVQVSATSLPQPLKNVIDRIEVPVTGLPQGLSVTGAEVVPDGVAVTVTGQDVVLHS